MPDSQLPWHMLQAHINEHWYCKRLLLLALYCSLRTWFQRANPAPHHLL